VPSVTVDVVIVTALEEERDAVRARLPNCRQVAPTTDDVRVYYRSDLPVTFPDGKPGTYSIVLTSLATMGRVQATATTGDAIRRWQPRYVLLVGIAGGISDRDVSLGDVLVSDQVVDYERQKVTEEGRQYRFRVHPVDPRLLEAARNLPAAAWQPLIAATRPSKGLPTRHIGPIATGDKVVAYKPFLEELQKGWPQLIGVEMEAGGVATAAFQAAFKPGFFMVRAVSDLADAEKGSARITRWRPYACDVAATYAIALLQSGPFLPVDGAGRTLASAEDTFRSSLNPAQLFNHSWTLVGREKTLSDLEAFTSSDQQMVAIVPGRGGIGKTKLLHAFADGFEQRFPDRALRFVREGIPVQPEDRDDLPAGPRLIVVDDAHRHDDIPMLCALAQSSAYPVKIILVTRPHAVRYLRSVLTHAGYDTSAITEFPPLDPLTGDDLKALARQALGEEHGILVDQLAAATKDCPLVTVVGGRLLAEKDLGPQELERDTTFRDAVLTRFQDVLLGNMGDYMDPALCRSLLPLIAAVAPMRPDNDQIVAAMAAHLDTDRPTIIRTLGALEDAGVLLRRGYTLRIAPDVLADHILHTACVTAQGQATGYAEAAFDRFAAACPQAVLANLAELDWRIRRTTEQEVTLLDAIWGRIESTIRTGSHWERCLLLGQLQMVAYHQPPRVLRLIEIVMDEPATSDPEADTIWGLRYSHDQALHRLPELLRHVGYTLEYLPRCCDLLWRLGRDDRRPTSPTPEHAMRVLADIATYDSEKPLLVNETVLAAVERWMRAPTVYEHGHSPLDVIDPLLAKVASSHRAKGQAIIFHPFHIPQANTRPLRERAMNIVEECARSPILTVALRALKSLEAALANPLPLFNLEILEEDLERWAPEQMETLERIARVVMETTHPLIHLSIVKAITWQARSRARREIRNMARAIIASIPESFDVRLAHVVFPHYDGWLLEEPEDPVEAQSRHQQRHEDRARAVAEEFLERYPDASVGANALDEQLRWATILEQRLGPQPAALLREIARQQPTYAAGLCDMVLATPQRPLASQLPTLLSFLRVTDSEHAATCVRSAVASGDIGLARSIAWLYRYAHDLTPDDHPVLLHLLTHTDPGVRQHAIGAIRVIGHSDPRHAVKLVHQVDIGESTELAEELYGLFDTRFGLPLSVLDDTDGADLLAKLEPVWSIEHYHVGQFIAESCSRWPRAVVHMLLQRITHDNGSQLEYRAFPYEGLHGGLNALAESDTYGDIIRELRDAALGSQSMIDPPVGRLFRQASQGYGEESLRALNEWVEGGDGEHLIAVSDLLRSAPRSFLFTHQDLVARLLERADESGNACITVVRSHLHGVAVGGVRQRGPGEPYPEDVEQYRKASEAAVRWTSVWPAQQFYKALAEEAKRSIEHELLQDETLADLYDAS